MKILQMSAKLRSFTPDPEEDIEDAGRTAYQSHDKITPGSAAKFIKMIIKRGHLSVLEHASARIRFVVDRGITHEMVRHRLIAATQESTRFCRYGEHIQVIQPPGLDEGQFSVWRKAVCEAERQYHELLSRGCKPEIARAVLPTCLKAEIAITANFREWLHIFDMRTSEFAHPQIREVMTLAKAQLATVAPNVFSAEDEDHE